MPDTNRRQFIAGVIALFGLRKRLIMKPRSLGMTTVSLPVHITARQLRGRLHQFPSDVWVDEKGTVYMEYMEEQYSRVLSVACGEPLEFKFDLSKAENNA